MDYYWGAVEKDTNHTACNTKIQLIIRIKEVFLALPRDTVKVACARFQSQIKAMLDAEGGFLQ